MMKPTILIYVINPEISLLSEVCAGMEEEGVCYEVVQQATGDIETLSYDSASASILGTGIGISESSIALTLSSLPRGRYVFLLLQANTTQARLLGTNAARVIKRKPFKGI
jgi:hypothetical protein